MRWCARCLSESRKSRKKQLQPNVQNQYPQRKIETKKTSTQTVDARSCDGITLTFTTYALKKKNMVLKLAVITLSRECPARLGKSG